MSLLQRLEKEKGGKIMVGAEQARLRMAGTPDPYREFKVKVHQEVIEQVDNEFKEKKDKSSYLIPPEELSLKVEELVNG